MHKPNANVELSMTQQKDTQGALRIERRQPLTQSGQEDLASYTRAGPKGLNRIVLAAKGREANSRCKGTDLCKGITYFGHGKTSDITNYRIKQKRTMARMRL